AKSIEQDADFKKAYAAKDRGQVAQAIKTIFDRAGFAGYATIVQENELIFYTSDAPAAHDVKPEDFNEPLLAKAFDFNPGSGDPNFPFGFLSLSPTQTFPLSSLMPVRQGSKVAGVIAVSTPFASDLLYGMERRIKLTSDQKDFDLVFYLLHGARITAVSSNVQ